MAVFRSKTFKKNRAARRKNRKTVRRQRGGYVPYRRDPPGGTYARILVWEDQKVVDPA
jgi:hypothetical protein